MKVKSKVKSGGFQLQHNGARTKMAKLSIKRVRGIGVRSSVRAGITLIGPVTKT
jgi:hypothetical protein